MSPDPFDDPFFKSFRRTAGMMVGIWLLVICAFGGFGFWACSRGLDLAERALEEQR